MIQPQELRIGNYIEYNGEIIKLDGSLLCCYIQNELEFPLNPIPLTEEILLKFGFEKITSKKDGFLADTYTYTKGISFIVYFDGVRLSVNFWQGNEKRYVHQLQNLYFALTGGELTFKN